MSMARDISHLDNAGGFRWPTYRFGIAFGGTDRQWHAVDLRIFGPQMATAASRSLRSGDVEVFSVCGTHSQYLRRLGQFTYESPFLTQQRCERCGWVVALNQGTVEREIDLFVGAAGALDNGLLRQIFTSILADLPPGREAESGHRSDLLAHAARHRPTVAVCQDCSSSRSTAEVHGRGATACPEAVLVCGSCTFTAGQWAGPREGMTTGECVVAAPCSVLAALAHHYELAPNGSWRSR